MKKSVHLKKDYALILLWLLFALYGIACLFLYYMQSIQPLDYDNRYFQSDLPYHLSMVLEDNWYYSFTAYFYLLFDYLTPQNTILTSVFLTAVTLLTVVFTEKLLRLLLESPQMSPLTFGGALLLNFVMPFFWEMAGMYRYVSYQSGNLWHNSTYQCMKLCAVLSLLLYWKIEKNYARKISRKDWLFFAAALVLTTAVKPSFLTVFAPAMALKLLWDLFHKVPFRQIFLFGCSVLPACAVVLWQNSVLFGSDTGQGFSLQPWYTFSLHADRPKLAVLCSIAFPLVILLFSVRELWKDKNYFFGWLMTGIGFLEALLLAESGSRSRDGNFLWGYCFSIFFLFIMSFIKWLQLYRKSKTQHFYKIPFLLSGMVLFYQTYCGIYFFLRLLDGETYFMLK